MSLIVVTIGAHPDDETLLAGGTIAWLVSQGATVRIVSVTRGEGGEVGDPPVTTRDKLGETRAGELRAAAAILGAASVDFLPFVDPEMVETDLDPAPPTALGRIAAEPAEFAAALSETLLRLQPDVLLTHGSDGEYGHPQHLYTHQIVRQVFETIGSGAAHPPAALYTWAATYTHGDDERLDRLLNQSDLAEWYIDLDETLLDRKAEAAAQHLSQTALFLRRAAGQPLRAMLIRRESLRRAVVHPGADDPLASLLAHGAPIAIAASPDSQ